MVQLQQARPELTHDQLVAAGGLYGELYRTQFAVADSPRPFTDADDTGQVVLVPPDEYVVPPQ